jgi:glycerophosphoryl diester phosphodiesterase
VKLVAHRGFAAVAPENTVRAVREATPRADAVEVDVRRCGSGELVVVHDETVDRVTDGSGRVADLDRATLAGLAVEGSVEGVPTLAAVVEAVPPSVELVVELKERGLATDAVAACEGFDGDLLVQSFDPGALSAAREVAPSVPRSLLFATEPRANLRAAVDLGCDAVGAHLDRCTPEFVAAAHERDLAVYGWTVDGRAGAERLVEAGVDAVVSDAPGVLAGTATGDRADGG